MAQTKRVPTRVHTRKIDRHIARNQMERIGLRKIAKHDYSGPLWLRVRSGSYFSEHWREYCVGGKEK